MAAGWGEGSTHPEPQAGLTSSLSWQQPHWQGPHLDAGEICGQIRVRLR